MAPLNSTARSAAATVAALRARAPDLDLVSDPDLRAGYETDITGRFRGTAIAVARPRSAEGVIATLAACRAEGVRLVVQGGNTGLVGGAVPRFGEVVLSLAALDWVGTVDRDSNQLDVGAGATLETARSAAAKAGLELPIDHPARASATIGGMVATDAGGPLALRHGTMRRRVAGLEFVLADGSRVARMAGLLKDNAGYDLQALLVGSEGTLAVITAVRLQLEPVQPFRLAALFGLADLPEALRLLRLLRAVPSLEAADIFDAASMKLVREQRGLRAPLMGAHGIYVIAQLAAAEDITEGLAAAVEGIDPEPEVVVATDTAGRGELWAYREAINESIRAVGVPHKLDVCVPIGALPAYDAAVRERIAAAFPDGRLYIYGHLGDGNLHVNLVGPEPDDDAVDELVLRCTAEFAGTISAEHGVGLAKRDYLSLCRSEADIEAMRALKLALDPTGLLGRGRVLPINPDSSYTTVGV